MSDYCKPHKLNYSNYLEHCQNSVCPNSMLQDCVAKYFCISYANSMKLEIMLTTCIYIQETYIVQSYLSISKEFLCEHSYYLFVFMQWYKIFESSTFVSLHFDLAAIPVTQRCEGISHILWQSSYLF